MITNPEDPYIKDAGIAIPGEDEKYNRFHSPTTGEFASGGGGIATAIVDTNQSATFSRNLLVAAKKKIGPNAGYERIKAKGNNAFLERAGRTARIDDIKNVIKAAKREGLTDKDIASVSGATLR